MDSCLKTCSTSDDFNDLKPGDLAIIRSSWADSWLYAKVDVERLERYEKRTISGQVDDNDKFLHGLINPIHYIYPNTYAFVISRLEYLGHKRLYFYMMGADGTLGWMTCLWNKKMP